MPKKNPLQLEFWSDEEVELWNVMIDFIISGFLDGVLGGTQALPAEMQVLVDWDVVNSAVLEFARNYRYTWIKDLTDTTRAHVQRAMTDWINSGEPLDALETKLATMFSPARAARIAATEVTRIYAQGNGEAWESTGYINASRWNTAQDEKVCPICGPLAGEIIGVGDIDAYPPAHVNCLPGDALVLPVGAIAGGSKRWYEGDVVTIRTLKNQLTVTPNHPVLTRRGWVGAGVLKQGDNVISYAPGEWEAFLVQVDEYNGISRIQDIFGSLDLPDFRMPVSAPDFHNDGAGSDVAVIRANGLVVDDGKAKFEQPFTKADFIPGNVVAQVSFSGLCPRCQLIFGNRAAPTSIMSGGDLSGSLAVGHPAPLDRFGFGLGTGIDARLQQTLANGGAVDPDFLSKLIFGHPGLVALDKVIEVRNKKFSGHVYNLQTSSGLFVADGIITHNCRCWLTPMVDEEALKRQTERILGLGS